SYVSNPICKGCLSCSKDNGCSRCQQKLFFFLRREGMRQYGECLHSCPSGYYGHRAPDMNRCARCRIENCDSCFSKDFCTKCKVGFYLHRGRCFDECPDGFAPLDETMECVGKRTPKAKEKRNKKKRRKLTERAQEQHSVFLATDRANQ
uniref:R-spondin 2 n=1 Tax=Cricetulus griseus TaxID=10029 RepID=A0A8C2LU20_CRIGR